MRANMRTLLLLGLVVVFLLVPLAGWCQHWTPPGWWPGAYAHTVWGEITGPDLALDETSQIAAFSGGGMVGLCYITVSGGYWYNMVIHATTTDPVVVYFLVWDGIKEIGATPNFTAYPAMPPPETRHDLYADQGQGVPELPSLLTLAISVGSAIFFRRRRRSSPVQR